MRNSYRTIGLWVILIILFVAFYQVFSGPQEPTQNLTWQSVQKLIEEGEVTALEVTIENGRGTGRGRRLNGERFVTDSRSLSDFAEVEKQGVSVVFTEKQGSLWSTILVQWLPIIFLFLFFIFFMRQLQGKKVADKLALELTVERVSQAPKLEGLKEVRARLKVAAEAAKNGTAGPRKILITGAPGTGKTTLLRALAADTGLPLLACAGSTFIEVFVGVGAARIRTLFKRAGEEAPCLVAIDDLDGFATKRTVPEEKGLADERGTTMLELANHLDGLAKLPLKTLFLATTSRPDILDEAIVRPGRFDLRISLLPNGEATIEELKR